MTATRPSGEQERTGWRRPRPTAVLWFVVWVGPLAWTFHLLVSYWLVPIACRRQHDWFMHGTTLVALAVAAGGPAFALRRLRRVAPLSPEGVDAASARRGDATSTGGSLVLALGVLLGAFFLLVILVGGLAPVIQDSCARPA